MSSTLREKIASEFDLEKEIKRSDRGAVCLVRDQATKTRYIYREFTGNGDVYYKLKEIKCPYLPRIEAVEEDNGTVFVLEEYIQGDTLAFLLHDCVFLEEQARNVMIQLCDALEILHVRGIVHRDIKPENVILRGDEAVLIDFDASRLKKGEQNTDTQVMGTTGYAAPEQYGFAQTDARADIYAMGILFNAMLTKQHPSRKLAEGDCQPIISRCIEVNVDRRYASVRELRDALKGTSVIARPKRKPYLAAAILLLCTVLLGGGWFVYRETVIDEPDIPTLDADALDMTVSDTSGEQSETIQSEEMTEEQTEEQTEEPEPAEGEDEPAPQPDSSAEQEEDQDPSEENEEPETDDMPDRSTEETPVQEPQGLAVTSNHEDGKVEIHQVKAGELVDGHLRFTVDFTAPKGLSTCVFNPPDGNRFKLFPGEKKGQQETKQFDIPVEQLAGIKQICLNFWTKDSSEFYFVDISELDLPAVTVGESFTEKEPIKEEPVSEETTVERPLNETSIVRINGNGYTSLAEAMADAKAGDTVTVLDDMEDVGVLTLKSGVTLDGCGYTISGASMIQTETAGRMIVKNLNFKDITGITDWTGAINARGITSEADLTVTGCTFDNTTWYSICVYTSSDQVKPPSVTIANNIFTDSDLETKDEKTGKSTCMTHIYLGTNGMRDGFAGVPINLTVKNNKMYGDSTLNLQYHVAEGSKIRIANNYIEDQESIRMTLSTDGTDKTHYQSLYLIESFADESLTVTTYPEVMTSKGLYTCGVFYTSFDQVPWEDLLTTETLYLMRDITIEDEVTVVGTLETTGHTLTLMPGASLTYEKELQGIAAAEGYVLSVTEENGQYTYRVEAE